MSRPRPLDDLRVADLTTLLAVARCQSVTGAARELEVTPSQVSKAIARLERGLRVSLLERTVRGVTVTDACRRVLPHATEIVSRWKTMTHTRTDAPPELTIAAPSYLGLRFFPAIAECLVRGRVRAIELPPAQVRALIGEHTFDMAPTLGSEQLPPSWVSVTAGELKKCLYASPTLAATLGPQPIAPASLRGVPFIAPLYNAGGLLLPGDDDCPLRRADRTLGHEAETIGLALELAARTPHVVFGPEIAARPFVRAGTLVPLRIVGWDVRDSLYVVCNGERVLKRTQNAIVRAVRQVLAG